MDRIVHAWQAEMNIVSEQDDGNYYTYRYKLLLDRGLTVPIDPMRIHNQVQV